MATRLHLGPGYQGVGRLLLPSATRLASVPVLGPGTIKAVWHTHTRLDWDGVVFLQMDLFVVTTGHSRWRHRVHEHKLQPTMVTLARVPPLCLV